MKWVQADVRCVLIGAIVRFPSMSLSSQRQLRQRLETTRIIHITGCDANIFKDPQHINPSFRHLPRSQYSKYRSSTLSDQSKLVDHHAYQFRSMDAGSQARTSSQGSAVS